jgi:hypothetical protein
VISGIGVIVVAALICVAQTEPAPDAYVEAPQSHPTASLEAGIPSASDPTPFGYLVFDWTGQPPGFGPIDPAPAPTQRAER